jgi:hypothetical protein
VINQPAPASSGVPHYELYNHPFGITILGQNFQNHGRYLNEFNLCYGCFKNLSKGEVLLLNTASEPGENE